MFELSRTIEIDMGHRVPTHGSKCKNLHGHRYKIEAIVSSHELIGRGEQTAMTMDFGFLKDVMMHKIHDVFDHGLAVYMHDELLTDILITGILPCNIQALQGSATSYQPVAALGGLKVILTSFIPTAEALARAWWYAMEKDVRARSAHNARLEAVRVHETPNSVGVYYHA